MRQVCSLINWPLTVTASYRGLQCVNHAFPFHVLQLHTVIKRSSFFSLSPVVNIWCITSFMAQVLIREKHHCMLRLDTVVLKTSCLLNLGMLRLDSARYRGHQALTWRHKSHLPLLIYYKGKMPAINNLFHFNETVYYLLLNSFQFNETDYIGSFLGLRDWWTHQVKGLQKCPAA